jgi:hypothetical protein
MQSTAGLHNFSSRPLLSTRARSRQPLPVSAGAVSITTTDSSDNKHTLRTYGLTGSYFAEMAQHPFNQMGGGGGTLDPTDLSMGGTYNGSFQNYNNANQSHGSGFSSGSALLGDDELFDTLESPAEQQGGMQANGQGFGGMNDMSSYAPGIYAGQQSLQMDQQHMNGGFSHTPEGEPMQSPFTQTYRTMQHPQFGSMQSPGSYSGSPLATAEARSRMSQTMQRKVSSTRSPLNTKSALMTGMPIGSSESYGQSIRNGSEEKQWIQTPNSLSSFPPSGFSSPMGPMPGAHINEMMLKAGTSMPAKLGTPPMTSSQEAKRKRRRESHNLVERRRRDNINERIQDLSKLVPLHRLEDEKVKKLIASGTPLSPTLTGIASPGQATSSLAGPGARRAASGATGSITTGLPVEDKDKGPNKGDILNGAVSWTRDLMWLLDLHIARQEELIEHFTERGEALPFTITDDEQRMTSELINAMREEQGNGKRHMSYTRTAGSGLRVPDYTDYKGDALNGAGHVSTSPDDGSGVMVVNEFVDQNQLWDDDDGSGDLDLKEEDEFMDLA